MSYSSCRSATRILHVSYSLCERLILFDLGNVTAMNNRMRSSLEKELFECESLYPLILSTYKFIIVELEINLPKCEFIDK